MGRIYKYDRQRHRKIEMLLGVFSLAIIVCIIAVCYYFDNNLGSSTNTETNPSVEILQNMLCMSQINTNGIEVMPQGSVMVELNGFANENAYIPLAYIETSKLELGKSYIIRVMSNTTFASLMLYTSNGQQVEEPLLRLGAVEAWREGIEIIFEIPEHVMEYEYAGVCAFVERGSEVETAQVYMALHEGSNFWGWEKFCHRKYDNPEYTGNWKPNSLNDIEEKILVLGDDATLRYAVATDIHVNRDDSANTGLDGDAKTQLFVDAVNAEHKNMPIDFLVITGDIIESGGEKALRRFNDKFMPQFEMPVILLPGNHDGISNSEWLDATGFSRQMSWETDDFYFIYVDVFGDNLGKTWLSHWAVEYDSGEAKAYITCDPNDEGAQLVGKDISVTEVAPIMRGWSNVAEVGNYVKLACAKDADMYKAPSLEYVKQEVEKAGEKYIVFAAHQILSAYPDGDSEGVREYLKSIDHYVFSLEGHCHNYYDTFDSNSDTWNLNSGHFHVPMGGWDEVKEDNYMGFRIIEVEDGYLTTYKVQPTQAVGTAYAHSHSIVAKRKLFPVVILD